MLEGKDLTPVNVGGMSVLEIHFVCPKSLVLATRRVRERRKKIA